MDKDGLGDDVHVYCDPGPQGDDTQVAWANCMISLPLNVNYKGGWGAHLWSSEPMLDCDLRSSICDI